MHLTTSLGTHLNAGPTSLSKDAPNFNWNESARETSLYREPLFWPTITLPPPQPECCMFPSPKSSLISGPYIRILCPVHCMGRGCLDFCFAEPLIMTHWSYYHYHHHQISKNWNVFCVYVQVVTREAKGCPAQPAYFSAAMQREPAVIGAANLCSPWHSLLLQETVIHYRCCNFSSESDCLGSCKSKSWLPLGNPWACKHSEMSEMKAFEGENEFLASHWSLFHFYSLVTLLWQGQCLGGTDCLLIDSWQVWLLLEALALGPNQETRAVEDAECPCAAQIATCHAAKATADFLSGRLGLSEHL